MTDATMHPRVAKVLMCRPTHYKIQYAINPWMTGSQVDSRRASEQFQALVAAYDGLDVQTVIIDQHPDLPDMVFTANAGLPIGETFIPSNFRYAERAPESALFKDYFKSIGKTVLTLDSDIIFEGAGDGLFCGDRLFLGYGFRSSKAVNSAISSYAPNHTVVSLGLSNPYFYHLDTCFSPLPSGRFCYYPDAFDDQSRKTLEGMDGYWVTERFCVQYGCNMVVAGGTILTSCVDDRLREIANQEQLELKKIDISEFLKAGGGVRCLSLFY